MSNKYEYINVVSKIARLEDLLSRINNYKDLTPEEEFEKERYKAVLRKLHKNKEKLDQQNLFYW